MIRAYRPSDLDATVSLFQRSVHEIASRDYSPAEVSAWAPEAPDLKAWARRLETGGVFVCERDDRLVGFARIDDSGYIDLLYVHPEAERHGIARALLGHVISWAAHRGIRNLRSEVSLTARSFFEAGGFRVLGEQRVERRGVWLRNLRMERQIDVEPSVAADAPQAARR